MITRFQLTYEDVMALQKDAIKNTFFHQRRNRLSFILMEIFVFLATLLILSEVLPNSHSPSLYLSVAILIAMLVALLFAPVIKRLYMPITLWQYKKLLKKRKDKLWPRSITLILDDEGLETRTEHNKVQENLRITWEAVQKVSEDENLIFVYFEEMDAIIVPKIVRDTNQENQIEFHKVLKRYLDNFI